MREKPKEVVIIGAGGHAKEVATYCLLLGITVKAFLDDFKTGTLENINILPFNIFFEEPSTLDDPFFHLALGQNSLRKNFAERVKTLNKSFSALTIASGTSSTGLHNKVGEGTLLASGAVLTTSISLGRHCIVNVKASISHDCIIEDFVNVNPGATLCGNVKVGEGSFIGAGATIIQGITVGKWSTVGAGSVVIDDVPDFTTVVGIPARPLSMVKARHG